jgi:hypothetical protein
MGEIDDIYGAIEELSNAINRLENRAQTNSDWDYVKWARETLKRGRKAYRSVSEQWPRLQTLREESERAYDAYVQRPG